MQPAPVDYPRMLYHADGRTRVVATPEEHNAQTPAGWGTIPLAVHLQRPVWHHGIPRRQKPLRMAYATMVDRINGRGTRRRGRERSA